MAEIHNLSRESLMKRVYWYEKKYGPYIEKKGLKNWKNLFRKPTFYEWIIFAMLLLGLFLGWAYKQDVTAYQTALFECEDKFQITLPPLDNGIYEWTLKGDNFTIKEASNNDTGIG